MGIDPMIPAGRSNVVLPIWSSDPVQPRDRRARARAEAKRPTGTECGILNIVMESG